MNDKTGGRQGPRRAGPLAVAAAAAVLAAACGGSASPSASSASAGSATYRKDLAFAHCMRSHGAPDFPDPKPSESLTVRVSQNAHGPMLQAYDACKQLLPRGSMATNSGHVTQQQLNRALKVTQCLRAHGEPKLPDPKVVNGKLNFSLNGISIQSAQFQDAVNACRSLIPNGVHLP